MLRVMLKRQRLTWKRAGDGEFECGPFTIAENQFYCPVYFRGYHIGVGEGIEGAKAIVRGIVDDVSCMKWEDVRKPKAKRYQG